MNIQIDSAQVAISVMRNVGIPIILVFGPGEGKNLSGMFTGIFSILSIDDIGVTKVVTPWVFRQSSKSRGHARFKETDRIQSYQLVMRTELIHSAVLHLSLHNL
jgi:hypothetical protein